MAEEAINKMMSSDGEISSMAERAASLLRQLIEDGCAAAKPLAEMVEYCAKHAAGEAQGKEEEVLDGESSDEEETDILRLEASLMGVENMLSDGGAHQGQGQAAGAVAGERPLPRLSQYTFIY
ncbi:hypothetical protein OsI_21359 [Oryza sativa Indica Group]|uniref:Uncharacterized protein n=1 Tax=Oryza sativa subsp. indica TaxID=39946 RepID=A2Y8I1_ORYSI|nr:hypothetical protein OsI_21359 [Oryza sativa Indica Group]